MLSLQKYKVVGYIIAQDYLRTIQEVQQKQLLTSNPIAQVACEATAEEEAKSFLRQKYLIDQEMTPFTIYDPTKQYYAQDRVYLDAPAYVPTNNYSVGNIALNAENVYICTATTTGAFDISKWSLLGPQFTMYYGAYPAPPFDLYAIYAVGDIIYYSGHKYKALQNSVIVTPSIQYVNYQDLPYPNVLPTNTTYWQDLGAYLIPIANNLSNTTYWTQGDNRNQELLSRVIASCLYHLHTRLSPRNIPDLRVIQYMGVEEDRAKSKGRLIYPTYCALGWYQAAGEGEITPTLPRIQPKKKGSRIRFGGPIKTQNSY